MTRVLALSAVAVLLVGCATPISVQVPDLQQPPIVKKLVVMPFASDPAPGGIVQEDGAAVVTTRVLQALTQGTHFDVVPPGEAARVGAAGSTPTGAELKKQFGVDAILTGVVRRYVERVGGPNGAMKPAAVWFTMELRSPDGTLLWSGVYNETQQGLSDDLGSFQRAWDRSFKWVTAADLAGYGARQLSVVLAEDLGSWS